jgi:hypothetical protein
MTPEIEKSIRERVDAFLHMILFVRFVKNTKTLLTMKAGNQ